MRIASVLISLNSAWHAGVSPRFVSHSFDGDAERFDAAAQLFSHCGFEEPDHPIDNLFGVEQFDAGGQERLIARQQASLVAKY